MTDSFEIVLGFKGDHACMRNKYTNLASTCIHSMCLTLSHSRRHKLDSTEHSITQLSYTLFHLQIPQYRVLYMYTFTNTHSELRRLIC